jgi:O-succinylhomoserine sulfhydrylase
VLYPFRHDHPGHNVAKKQMTGGGTVIALDLGTREAAFKFLNALEIVDISNNLGDAKSMATHPPTTTHRSVPEDQRPSLGVTEGGVRLSVGPGRPGRPQARCDPCARSGVRPRPAAADASPSRPGRLGL